MLNERLSTNFCSCSASYWLSLTTSLLLCFVLKPAGSLIKGYCLAMHRGSYISWGLTLHAGLRPRWGWLTRSDWSIAYSSSSLASVYIRSEPSWEGVGVTTCILQLFRFAVWKQLGSPYRSPKWREPCRFDHAGPLRERLSEHDGLLRVCVCVCGWLLLLSSGLCVCASHWCVCVLKVMKALCVTKWWAPCNLVTSSSN
jgi:hypothetical protein